MAWTQDDVDALKAAIATGVRSVQYADRSIIEYRTLAEMRSVLSEMQAEVVAAGAAVERVRTVRFNSCKGF